MNTHDEYQKLDFERDIWELEARHKRILKIQQILRLYVVSGAILAVAALAYFIISRVQIELSTIERITLMMAGIGFFVSIFSLFILYAQKQRYKEEVGRSRYMSAALEFLAQWASFENKSRAKLELEGKEFNPYSIREIVSRLIDKHGISSFDVALLEEAMRSRNYLVHTGKPIPIERLTQMTKVLGEITNRLSSR